MLAATTSTVRGAGGATGAGAGGAGGGCATASGCGAGGAGGGWECAQAATMNARATGTGTDRMVHSPLQGAIACACPLAVSKHNAGAGARRRSHCRAASLLMDLSTGCQPLLQFQWMGGAICSDRQLVMAVAHGNRIQIRPFPPTPRRRTPIADSQGGSGSFGCTTCLAGVDAGLLNSSLSGERGERN